MAGQPKKRAKVGKPARTVVHSTVEAVAPLVLPKLSWGEAVAKLDAWGMDAFVDAYVGQLKSLRDLSRELGIPVSTIFAWLNRTENKPIYKLAGEERAEALASELISIANEPVPTTPFGTMDSAAVQDKRVRIDTIKWVASKMLPRQYGEKLDLTSGGDPLGQMTDAQLDARLEMLQQKHAALKGELG